MQGAGGHRARPPPPTSQGPPAPTRAPGPPRARQGPPGSIHTVPIYIYMDTPSPTFNIPRDFVFSFCICFLDPDNGQIRKSRESGLSQKQVFWRAGVDGSIANTGLGG